MERQVERRRYRKVSTRMWGDEKFRSLSKPQPNGQSLWQYLITGPHTTSVPGLFMAGEAHLSERLGWPLAGFRRAWKEIDDAGMGMADWHACLVWLPNAIGHNVPESPNVVVSWKDALDELPACELRDRALCEMDAFLASVGRKKAFQEAFRKVLPHGFAKAFREGSAIPSANQEQDQDQEQEIPPTPHADARGDFRRPTRAERQHAEQVIRNAFGCRHDPRCLNHEACVVLTVLGLRERAS